MSRTLQFKRYGSATIANTVGANGELIINTTNKTLTVHDGITPGGFALLNSATDVNIDQYARNTANGADELAQSAYDFANTIVIEALSGISNGNTSVFIPAANGSAVITVANREDWIFTDTGSVFFPGGSFYNRGTFINYNQSLTLFSSNTVNNSFTTVSANQGNFLVSTGNNTITNNWQFNSAGTLTTPGNIVANGSILPSLNVTYNLGSANSQWKDLYLSGNTIYLGGSTLSVVNNNLTFNGNTVTGAGGVTGNISIVSTNSAINFVSNSSGDGQGYSTIELRPDTNATIDQYLIIDPTVPSHIHIRAGGVQDDSQAQLFLGGENSNFSVGTGANPPVYITANNNSWTFNTNGETSFPGLINATGVVLSGQASLTGVSEAYSGINNATGVVAHDCSNGYIFNHTSITNNFTANFTNLNIDNGRATTITLVLNQGATAYIANAIQINSVSQTIRWSANTIPTGNINAVDVQSFSILNVGGNYTVLGQLSTFG